MKKTLQNYTFLSIHFNIFSFYKKVLWLELAWLGLIFKSWVGLEFEWLRLVLRVGVGYGFGISVEIF